MKKKGARAFVFSRSQIRRMDTIQKLCWYTPNMLILESNNFSQD